MSFDYEKFKKLQGVLKKQGQFVPMDPSMAGGMPPGGDPAAMGAPPMDPSMMGGDPAAAGMPPVDPSMMGGGMSPPVDPSAMGMPPPPVDPSAMGMPPPPEEPTEGGDVSPSGEPYMKITPTQLSKLFKQFADVFKSVLGLGGSQPAQPQPVVGTQPQTDPVLQSQLAQLDTKLSKLTGV